MTDLAEVLNYTFDEAPQSLSLPPGDYMFRVHKVHTDEIPNNDRTPFAELSLVPIGVVSADGVDENNLRNYYPVRGRLWLSERALPVSGDILRKCFKRDITGKSVAVVLDELIGAEVRATIKTRVSDQGKTFVEVDEWLRPIA